ncbi:WecB/TagA/CpsF family glycosyltransferase [Myxosarcina sp. GI1]|uniref:WecB/TagA/CpsF family glycosyltransferase n=1 Tax=Myxosarcina sp. GI1 TaxID=1541065 RepID=UPI0005664058|nr:WecB/TagA/CpsF family glycosyltransferase [Myxosarcina sp. GI1]
MYTILDTVNLLNVSIHNITANELLEDLSVNGGVVVTPNVDHLVKLQSDLELLKAYYHSDYRVCDSKIIQYISYFLGSPIKEKISGSDFFPAFCKYNQHNEKIKIFLLGGKPGVAQQAQVKINQKIGRNIIVDSLSPSFGFEKNELECQEIIDRINASQANVLAIGVGAPKQEKWIAKYKHKLNKIDIFLAIGATIDFEAGHKSRAPKWMSQCGLEWLYRLYSEPQRLWKRYLVDSLPFFWSVGKQKFACYRFPYELKIQCLPLGELLQQAGLLSSSQIRQTLRLQANSNCYRFGELVVRQGYLNSKTVDFFAAELPQLIEFDCQLRLGEYLNKAGLLDRDQVAEALEYQRLTEKKFGEIIIQKGWINLVTLKWFIELQKQLVRVASNKELEVQIAR